jgi:hypothetical protein
MGWAGLVPFRAYNSMAAPEAEQRVRVELLPHRALFGVRPTTLGRPWGLRKKADMAGRSRAPFFSTPAATRSW